METGLTSDVLQSYLFNLRNQFGSQTQSTTPASSASSLAPVIKISRDVQTGLDILEKRLSSIIQDLPASRPQAVTPTETVPASAAVETRPADVARRVLNNVNQSRPVKSDDGEYLAQVKDGVEKGFSETSDLLLQLNRLNQDTLDRLSQTYALLQAGLDRVNTAGDNGGQAVSVPSLDSLSQTTRVTYERSLSTNLQIKTAEGDLVTIALTRKNGAEFSTSFEGDNNGSSLSVSRTVFSDVDFQYTVTGDLNGKETRAIKSFIENVAGVADKFFDGNLQDTLKKTAGLNDFGDEISSYSLTLTYDEILNAQSQTSASFSGNNLDTGTISNVLGDLAAASPIANLLTDAASLAQDIFNEKISARLDFDPVVATLPDSSKDLLNKLITSSPLLQNQPAEGPDHESEAETSQESGEENNHVSQPDLKNTTSG